MKNKKQKYEKPKLSSMNMPVKRAQGFETEGNCGPGYSVGSASGECLNGFTPTGPITACTNGGLALLANCSTGSSAFFTDGCADGFTVYGSPPSCSSGSNV